MTRVDTLKTDALTVSATTGRIVELFERAPHKVFFHLRDALGGIMGSHRREWLQRTDVQFKRGGLQAAAFGSRSGADGGNFRSDKKFFYIVDPKKKSVPPSETPDLASIKAAAFTHSPAALGLETGGTFRAVGNPFMAIPIGFALNKNGRPKPGFSSPRALKNHPRLVHKDTVAVKKPGKAPVIYIRKQLKRKIRMLPVFLLVRQVNRKPRLRFMATWQELNRDRDRRLSRALDRTVSELERGRK